MSLDPLIQLRRTLLRQSRARRYHTRRDLIQDAARHAERGDYRTASELYALLERIDARNPDWSVRHAEAHRRLGHRDAEVAARLRATERFQQSHRPLHAIAMCQRVLQLVPGHALAVTLLADLERDRPRGLARSEAPGEPPSSRRP
jgi:hypothetical protein